MTDDKNMKRIDIINYDDGNKCELINMNVVEGKLDLLYYFLLIWSMNLWVYRITINWNNTFHVLRSYKQSASWISTFISLSQSINFKVKTKYILCVFLVMVVDWLNTLILKCSCSCCPRFETWPQISHYCIKTCKSVICSSFHLCSHMLRIQILQHYSSCHVCSHMLRIQILQHWSDITIPKLAWWKQKIYCSVWMYDTLSSNINLNLCWYQQRSSLSDQSQCFC